MRFFEVFFFLAVLPIQCGFYTNTGGTLVGVSHDIHGASNLAYDVGHWHVPLQETRSLLPPFSLRDFFAGGMPGASFPVRKNLSGRARRSLWVHLTVFAFFGEAPARVKSCVKSSSHFLFFSG
ncbi:MAG: hypothetical protein LBR88_00530 [Zoogloeaceae bacterium]|jgi:hypothetical protein|nr:hypothetical protein [Zoogloeaceae bacterium]